MFANSFLNCHEWQRCSINDIHVSIKKTRQNHADGSTLLLVMLDGAAAQRLVRFAQLVQERKEKTTGAAISARSRPRSCNRALPVCVCALPDAG